MFLDFHLHYSSFFYFIQERKVIMSVNKAKTPTKDGKYWFFRVVYKDEFNTPKRYNSKKGFIKMTLKDVALKSECSVSTVSKTIQKKVIT